MRGTNFGKSADADLPSPRLAPDIVARYLKLLRVCPGSVSLQSLRELVAAHLSRVPFENISKLLYKRRFGLTQIPSIQTYLDGIERYRFGGTCYSNNFYFHCLLVSLGYDIKLCAADMASPSVHAVNVVNVDGHEYLVDAGYAAPFLEPLPRNLKTDYEVVMGRDRYVLKPQDLGGRSRLELYRDGRLKHGYLVKPEAKRIEDFRDVIADSFRKDATFLNSILLARFYPQRSIVIHNLNLIESRGQNCEIRTLANLAMVADAIQAHFEIPREVTAEALAELKALQDPWSDVCLRATTNSGCSGTC